MYSHARMLSIPCFVTFKPGMCQPLAGMTGFLKLLLCVMWACMCVSPSPIYVAGFDKSRLHTHNAKSDFSPPLDFYINELTIHVCIICIVPWSAFAGACFLGLSDVLKCSGGLQMAVVWTGKHPTGWKFPHNWPESLAIKLATICDI